MTRIEDKSASAAVKDILVQHPDGLREVIRTVMQEVLEAEMDETLGAEKSERTPERLRPRAPVPSRTDLSHTAKAGASRMWNGSTVGRSVRLSAPEIASPADNVARQAASTSPGSSCGKNWSMVWLRPSLGPSRRGARSPRGRGAGRWAMSVVWMAKRWCGLIRANPAGSQSPGAARLQCRRLRLLQ